MSNIIYTFTALDDPSLSIPEEYTGYYTTMAAYYLGATVPVDLADYPPYFDETLHPDNYPGSVMAWGLFDPSYFVVASGSSKNCHPSSDITGNDYLFGKADVDSEDDYLLIVSRNLYPFEPTQRYGANDTGVKSSIGATRTKTYDGKYGPGLFSFGIVGYAADGVTVVDPYGGNNIDFIHAGILSNCSVTDNWVSTAGGAIKLTTATSYIEGYGSVYGDIIAASGVASKVHPDVKFFRWAIKLNHSQITAGDYGHPAPGCVQIARLIINYTVPGAAAPTISTSVIYRDDGSIASNSNQLNWGEKFNAKAILQYCTSNSYKVVYTFDFRAVGDTNWSVFNAMTPATDNITNSIYAYETVGEFTLPSGIAYQDNAELRINMQLVKLADNSVVMSGGVILTIIAPAPSIASNYPVISNSINKNIPINTAFDVQFKTNGFNYTNHRVIIRLCPKSGDLMTNPFVGFDASDITNNTQQITISNIVNQTLKTASFTTPAVSGVFDIELWVKDISLNTEVLLVILPDYIVTAELPSFTYTISANHKSGQFIKGGQLVSVALEKRAFKSNTTLTVSLSDKTGQLASKQISSGYDSAGFWINLDEADYFAIDSEENLTGLASVLANNGGSFRFKFTLSYVDNGNTITEITYSDRLFVGGGASVDGMIFEDSFFFADSYLWDQYLTEIAANNLTHQVEFNLLKADAIARLEENWDVVYGKEDMIFPVENNIKFGSGIADPSKPNDQQILLVSKRIFPYNPVNLYKIKALGGKTIEGATYTSIGVMCFADDGLTMLDCLYEQSPFYFPGRGGSELSEMHNGAYWDYGYPTIGFFSGYRNDAEFSTLYNDSYGYYSDQNTSPDLMGLVPGTKYFRLAIYANHAQIVALSDGEGGQIPVRPMIDEVSAFRLNYVRLQEFIPIIGQPSDSSVYAVVTSNTTYKKWETIVATITATNFSDGLIFVRFANKSTHFSETDFPSSRFGNGVYGVKIINGSGQLRITKKSIDLWDNNPNAPYQETFRLEVLALSINNSVVATSDLITIEPYYPIEISENVFDPSFDLATVSAIKAGSYWRVRISAPFLPTGTIINTSNNFQQYLGAAQLNGSPISYVALHFQIDQYGESILDMFFVSAPIGPIFITLMLTTIPSLGINLNRAVTKSLVPSETPTEIEYFFYRIPYSGSGPNKNSYVALPPAKYVPSGVLGFEIFGVSGESLSSMDTDALMIMTSGTVTVNYSSVGSKTTAVYVAGLTSDNDWDVFIYNTASPDAGYRIEHIVYNGYFDLIYSRDYDFAPTSITVSYSVVRIRN